MSSSKKPVFDFEKSLMELEKIVKALENGSGLNLELSLRNFEQGVSLVRQCQTALSEAEQRVQILTQNTELKPYEDE